MKPRVNFYHRAAPVVVDELEESGVLAVVEIFLVYPYTSVTTTITATMRAIQGNIVPLLLSSSRLRRRAAIERPRRLQDVIQSSADLPGPVKNTCLAGLIVKIARGVCHGDHHETGLRQRERGVVMAGE